MIAPIANAATTAEPLWNVAQVATFLGMSRHWVYKAAERGALPSVRLGLGRNAGSLRFRPESIRAFAVDREQRASAPAPTVKLLK